MGSSDASGYQPGDCGHKVSIRKAENVILLNSPRLENDLDLFYILLKWGFQNKQSFYYL